MKSLFYIHDALCPEHLGVMLDEALEAQIRGEDILWVTCDPSMQICSFNCLGNAGLCHKCMFYEKVGRKKVSSGVRHQKISDFIRGTMVKEVDNLDFQYENLEDICNLEYDHIPIGYIALSTYISLTRNLHPRLDQEFRKYFDSLLKVGVKLILAFDALLNNYKPERVYLFTGRVIQTRPALELTLKKGIELFCMETYSPEGIGRFRKQIFINSMPHSILKNEEMMEEMWKKTEIKLAEKEKIGRSFFEKRRQGIEAGDKVYTGHQRLGLLPIDWDVQKENIVIFNSSEDEFAAIGKEWSNKLYPLQIDGVKAIAEHYINDSGKHFYLKIHPNLIFVKYKYHMDLYKLQYPNLTIIQADSNISTYSMIDAADKVVVFGSTVGIEAAYWKKPVLLLGPSMYQNLGVTYNAFTENQLWSFLDKSDLPPLYNENILKYGYYNMNTDQPVCRLDIDWYVVKGRKKVYRFSKYMTLYNSRFLFIVFMVFYRQILKYFYPRQLFSKIPADEA